MFSIENMIHNKYSSFSRKNKRMKMHYALQLFYNILLYYIIATYVYEQNITQDYVQIQKYVYFKQNIARYFAQEYYAVICVKKRVLYINVCILCVLNKYRYLKT